MEASNYKIPVADKAYFEKAHTMVLVSTFPRSGSTLLGYLLTAHRHIVVANEPAGKGENLYDEIPITALLNYILFIDKMRFDNARTIKFSEESKKTTVSDSATNRFYNKRERYKFVPNQWQGCCESLHVIGIKNSSWLAKALLLENVFAKFKENLKKSGIRRLKFIVTVRNPYDMITTGIVYRAANPRGRTISEDEMCKHLDIRLRSQFIAQCRKAAKIFELMEPQNIFLNKHEDMVAAPAEQLSKLCEFLNVRALPDYLNDCASVVHGKPNKSRYELKWSEEQKAKMAEIIEKYHFLAGYSWDS